MRRPQLGEEQDLLPTYIEPQLLCWIVCIFRVPIERHVLETNNAEDVDVMGSIVVLAHTRAHPHQELLPPFWRILSWRRSFNNEPVVTVKFSVLHLRSIFPDHQRSDNNCIRFVPLFLAVGSKKWFTMDGPVNLAAIDDLF